MVGRAARRPPGDPEAALRAAALNPRAGVDGLLHGLGFRHGSLKARLHLAGRLPLIRAALDAAPPGFVFVTGNSHAELLGPRLGTTPPFVNGGIGGASARDCADHIAAMRFSSRAAVAVLLVGTNDIRRRDRPLSARRLRAFETACIRLVDWLGANADRVLVSAVPPLGPNATDLRDPDAVAVYSRILEDVSAQQGCRFVDAFAELRSGDWRLAADSMHPDGIHLADYPTFAETLDRIVAQARSPLSDAG